MTRDRYPTRSILLRGDAQAEAASTAVLMAPRDKDNPVEVVIREPVKARHSDQNRLYWHLLGEIAEQAYFNNKQYTSDIWHEYARIHIMPEQITTKDGVVRSKWLEMPDGKATVISTTKLERSCFAEYTNLVEVMGAEMGVLFSANPGEI